MTMPRGPTGEEVTEDPVRCALCRRERQLCDSHIIPEFMYRPGYDEKGRLSQIDVKTGRRPFIQKGYRESLLCEHCEGFLNDNYEKPFNRAWYERGVLSEFPTDAEVVLARVDYAPFKLFHLSVLWRASVASGGGFQTVDLGSHEEPLRNMITDGDPGDSDQYPLIAIARTFDGDLVHGAVMTPAVIEYEGMRLYSMMYGGFEWITGVANHCPGEVRELALTKDGRMEIPVRQWRTSRSIRMAWEAHQSRRDVPDD